MSQPAATAAETDSAAKGLAAAPSDEGGAPQSPAAAVVSQDGGADGSAKGGTGQQLTYVVGRTVNEHIVLFTCLLMC
jgi:hypothetical protein